MKRKKRGRNSRRKDGKGLQERQGGGEGRKTKKIDD